MNFLAHLILSEPAPEAWVGSLWPDLCRRPLPLELPARVREHAARHHAVDRFTDSHPLFRRGRERLAACGLRHYLGVVLDVVYDHFLARDWARLYAEPLPTFARRVYDGLDQATPHLAPAMVPACERMRRYDWLNHYAHWDGLVTALDRLSRRTSGGVRLTRALPEVAAAYHPLANDFHEFFAELRAVTAHPLAPAAPPSTALAGFTHCHGKLGA